MTSQQTVSVALTIMCLSICALIGWLGWVAIKYGPNRGREGKDEDSGHRL